MNDKRSIILDKIAMSAVNILLDRGYSIKDLAKVWDKIKEINRGQGIK